MEKTSNSVTCTVSVPFKCKHLTKSISTVVHTCLLQAWWLELGHLQVQRSTWWALVSVSRRWSWAAGRLPSRRPLFCCRSTQLHACSCEVEGRSRTRSLSCPAHGSNGCSSHHLPWQTGSTQNTHTEHEMTPDGCCCLLGRMHIFLAQTMVRIFFSATYTTVGTIYRITMKTSSLDAFKCVMCALVA